MQTRHCEHVKTNGRFCGSPAMRDRNYCYFHLNVLGRKLRAEKQALRAQDSFELPLLEDAASIQLALMQVSNALVHGTIDPKRAGLVLYALQTASSNLRNMEKEAEKDQSAAVCNSYDSFEQDFDLEDRDDLRVDDSQAESDGVPTVTPSGEKLVPLSELSEPYAHRGSRPTRNPETGKPWVVLNDPQVELPWYLTENQYYEARARIFQYEMDHDVDKTKSRKIVPERPALSQKLFLGLRKPPQSLTGAEEEQLATSN